MPLLPGFKMKEFSKLWGCKEKRCFMEDADEIRLFHQRATRVTVRAMDTNKVNENDEENVAETRDQQTLTGVSAFSSMRKRVETLITKVYAQGSSSKLIVC